MKPVNQTQINLYIHLFVKQLALHLTRFSQTNSFVFVETSLLSHATTLSCTSKSESNELFHLPKQSRKHAILIITVT